MRKVKVSEYSYNFYSDIIAEIFSKVTDKYYRFGQLPQEFEHLVLHTMLGIFMDEKKSKR